jgi:hypothetical protein
MRLPLALTAAALLSLVPPRPATAFAPGEETVFQVRYLNLPTGEGRIAVGKAEGGVWPVIFQVRTNGVASPNTSAAPVTYWDSSANLTRGRTCAHTRSALSLDSACFSANARPSVQRKGPPQGPHVRRPGGRPGPHGRVHVAEDPAPRSGRAPRGTHLRGTKAVYARRGRARSRDRRVNFGRRRAGGAAEPRSPRTAPRPQPTAVR